MEDYVKGYIVSQSEKFLEDLENSFISNVEDSDQTLMTLHKLFSVVLDSGALSWKVVILLEKISLSLCTDVNALIVLRKFIPELLKLLTVTTPNQKKIRVLNLLQKLTYGVKKEALTYMHDAMEALIDVILKQEPEVLPSALSVLVNIVWGSEVAVFTLLSHPDCKSMMHKLLKSKTIDSSVSYEVQKLTVILNLTHGANYIADKDAFITCTFDRVEESSGDMLSRSVDFFYYVVEKKYFGNDVSGIGLDALVENFLCNLKKKANKEDVSSCFKFLKSLVKVECQDLFTLYPEMIEAAVTCTVSRKFKCSEALELCCMIISSMESKDFPDDLCSSVFVALKDLFSKILTQLFIFEEFESEDAKENYLVFQLSLLRLLSVATQSLNTLKILSAEFNVEDLISSFCQMFLNTRDQEKHRLETELCVEFLSLLSCFALTDTACLRAGQNLLLDVQTVSLLGNAFKTGDFNITELALNIVTSAMFPCDRVPVLAKNLSNFKFSCSNDYLKVNDVRHMASSSLDDHLSKSKVEDAPKTKALEFYETKISLLDKKVMRLQQELSNSSLSAVALQKEVAVSNKLRSALTDELLEANAAFLKTQEAYASSVQKFMVLEEQTKERSSTFIMEIDNLRKAAQILAQDMDLKMEKNKRLHKEISQLKCEASKREQIYLETRAELAQLSEEHCCLKEQQSNSLEKIRDEQAKQQKLIQNLDELQTEKQELKQEMQKQVAKISILEEENAKKEKELVELKRIRDTVFQITGGNKRI